MRISLLLTVAACGHVLPDPPMAPPDATLPDSPPDAQPDAQPDASGSCHIANSMPPMWVDSRDFTLVDDPTRRHPLVWVSNGAAPSGSFTVAFADGDRITGLAVEAYGNGSAGLRNIQAAYKPSAGAPWQTLATGEDLGRAAQWGQVSLPNFQAAVLSSSGQILVTFDVTGTGYFIGPVTADLERDCGMH